MGSGILRLALILIVAALGSGSAPAEEDYERDPIAYWRVTPDDPVSRLRQRVERGDLKLDRSNEKALLRTVLAELNVPESSQVLVFSKTSLQRSHISPAQPRAIYFSDNIYVGWVPGGNIELSCFDAAAGPTFYLMEVRPDAGAPAFSRPQNCLSCHAGTRTDDMPGYMVRSVFPSSNGEPILSAGSELTDHSSPIGERWGGWYVTGLHDPMRHRGNVTATESGGGVQMDFERGSNLKSLAGLFDTSRYLLDQSDIVALLVLEHQVGMHNVLAHGSYVVRMAVHRQEAIQREMDLAGESPFSESTGRIIDSEAEKIVRYMLFCDETEMASEGVTSTTSFPDDFQGRDASTPRDQSLRTLHLGRRLFRNRCSYMIHSTAFDAMPAPLATAVARLTGEALAGPDPRKIAAHIPDEEKSRIRQILSESRPALVAGW